VETTNALGYDPDREVKGRGKVTRPGGTAGERHGDKRREVGEAGLAAVIAYNHGVAFSKEKKFTESVRANLRALALDPDNPSAAKNLVADLTNWPLELAKEKQYEAGLSVLAVGLEIAPKEHSLQNNHKALWAEYAESLMKAGKAEDAVDVLRRARKALGSDEFEKRQGYLFAGPAEELVKAGKWAEALEVIDRGMRTVDPKALNVLKDQRVGVFLRWGVQEYEAGRYEEALKVLERAAKEEKDGRILNNTLAVYDGWADKYIQRGQWAEAVRVYEKGLRQLPGDKHLAHNLAYCREQMKK
jgi:tetratricopeptide (TPR) repeat protein